MTAENTQPWWQRAVFYQIYPRSFKDANGDGIGDLAGIIENLDYLKGKPDSLGVDALWLSPVYPSPQHDFGYDIKDYRNIDPLFGDLATFQKLLKEAHARDIKVVMDLVVNHTSWEHPWFRESRSSRDSPKRDWYIWRDGEGDGPPNNWRSLFGGPAWQWDEQSQQYYLHLFLKEQPDLNWRNPEVQEAIWEIMRYWLEMGVDGFRLDVYNFYFKDATLRSNPRRRSLRGLFYAYEGQHHIYDQDQPEMYGALAKMREIVDSYPGDRMLVGETSTIDNFQQAYSYYGQDHDGLNLVFNFEFLNSRWRAKDFRQAIIHWQQHAPNWSWPTWVLSNHDVIRHFTRYAQKGVGHLRARVAASMLLTLKGTPFLYYGDEIGMREGRLSRSMIQDPPGKKFWPFFRGRDGCRTPMQWTAGEQAGFSTVRPWLPINKDKKTVNVESEQQNEQSLFQYYQRLIALRKNTPALLSGALHLLDNTPEQTLVYRRSLGDDTLWIALNFSQRKTTISLNFSETMEVVLATHHPEGHTFSPGSLKLEPDEALICRKSK